MATRQVLMSKLLNELKKISRQLQCLSHNDTTTYKMLLSELRTKKKKIFEVGSVFIIKKVELKKKEDDEIHEESWVRCDKCVRCIHQICALCNTCQNKDQRSKYVCPSYTIETR
jgi:hypothetical protein